jgi:Domain of unknown function (DUF4351)
VLLAGLLHSKASNWREPIAGALRPQRKRGEMMGAEKGERNVLHKLLEMRFGPLSPEASGKLEAFSEQRLGELTDRLLGAQSLRELGLEEYGDKRDRDSLSKTLNLFWFFPTATAQAANSGGGKGIVLVGKSRCPVWPWPFAPRQWFAEIA